MNESTGTSPEMTGKESPLTVRPRLLGLSFHSVKGGVGKSTLSVACAQALARALQKEGPSTAVVLMDMDLTGTSLADVLPVEAPCWTASEQGWLDLLTQPETRTFYSERDTRTQIDAREKLLEEHRQSPQLDEGAEEDTGDGRSVEGPPHRSWCVPYLNDFLLFAMQDWQNPVEVPVEALLWQASGLAPGLQVIPSSALPDDLEEILPLIYDEERAAFLEGRLERLLEALLKRYSRVVLVVDTPPTLPGLSRSVLSLALRLGLTPRRALAEGEELSFTLGQADIKWQAFLVSTPDTQDLRAMVRWLNHIQPQEEAVLRFVINRAPAEPGDQQNILTQAQSYSVSTVVQQALWVSESPTLQRFRAGEQDLSTGADTGADTGAGLEQLDPLILEGLSWLRGIA